VICCGRRWGKTTEAIEEIKGKALYRPTRIAYIANTYQQARDIAWEQLKNELRPIITDANESRLELKVKTIDGKSSLIILRGWESVDTLRGQKFDFLVLDEVASMRNFWTNWSEVLRPTLTDTKGEAMFISTPAGFNHFYELFNVQLKDKDYKSFHFSSYDNPHLPKEEIDKAKQELTEDRFAQEYLADFRKTQGLVYKEFDRTRHLYTEEPTNIIETIAGHDWGTTNPCCTLTIKRDYDNHFWVSKEWYVKGKTEAEQVDHIAAEHFNKVYPDPESASGVQELRKRGVNVRDVIKGKDSVRIGINKVRELFKAGRLHIHTSLVNLIWELETYSYPDKKELRNEDENPIKEGDHACDALRMPLMMVTDTIQRLQRAQETATIPTYGQRFTSYIPKV
jgi:PBSX family phage terminase large subunit